MYWVKTAEKIAKKVGGFWGEETKANHKENKLRKEKKLTKKRKKEL